MMSNLVKAKAKAKAMVVLLCVFLSAPSSADSTSGDFSVDGVKFELRDFIIVHEEREERIRLYLTDLVLTEEQKKYLAGNRGNPYSHNTAEFYIPVQLTTNGIYRDTNAKIEVYSFGKTGGFWPIPGAHFSLTGNWRELRIVARGEATYRGKRAIYDLDLKGKTYSSMERERRVFSEISSGDRTVAVETYWDRKTVTPTVSIGIKREGTGFTGRGQGFKSGETIRELIDCLQEARPFKYHGLELIPKGDGLLLKIQGVGKGGPWEFTLGRAEALELALAVGKAAKHVNLHFTQDSQ